MELELFVVVVVVVVLNQRTCCKITKQNKGNGLLSKVVLQFRLLIQMLSYLARMTRSAMASMSAFHAKCLFSLSYARRRCLSPGRKQTVLLISSRMP